MDAILFNTDMVSMSRPCMKSHVVDSNKTAYRFGHATVFPLSINRIIAHVVIDARPKPLTCLKLEYIQMFVEKVVISEAVDIIRHER